MLRVLPEKSDGAPEISILFSQRHQTTHLWNVVVVLLIAPDRQFFLAQPEFGIRSPLNLNTGPVSASLFSSVESLVCTVQ